jgi:hypothetical protein
MLAFLLLPRDERGGVLRRRQAMQPRVMHGQDTLELK